jgi:hypothetical protein
VVIHLGSGFRVVCFRSGLFRDRLFNGASILVSVLGTCELAVVDVIVKVKVHLWIIVIVVVHLYMII